MEFELAFPYNIEISPTVNGGTIVRVGCAELSFSSTNKMLTALRDYFKDPEGAEKQYHELRKSQNGPIAEHGSGRALRFGPIRTAPPEAPAPRDHGVIQEGNTQAGENQSTIDQMAEIIDGAEGDPR